MNKRIFVTPEAYSFYKKTNLKTAQKLPKNSLAFFKKETQKKDPIYIYDCGFNKEQQIIPVSNHINKTGSNPLIGNQKKQIMFFDITNIYSTSKPAKTAVCFGNQKPVNIEKNMIGAHFLCHHVIAAYCAGFKTIFAYVID